MEGLLLVEALNGLTRFKECAQQLVRLNDIAFTIVFMGINDPTPAIRRDSAAALPSSISLAVPVGRLPAPMGTALPRMGVLLTSQVQRMGTTITAPRVPQVKLRSYSSEMALWLRAIFRRRSRYLVEARFCF